MVCCEWPLPDVTRWLFDYLATTVPELTIHDVMRQRAPRGIILPAPGGDRGGCPKRCGVGRTLPSCPPAVRARTHPAQTGAPTSGKCWNRRDICEGGILVKDIAMRH
jgi:hypothetical protein